MPALPVDAGLELRLQRERHLAFVSTLAHELRQPLSAMSSAARILREGTDPTALAAALDIIDRQARQLDQLVEDLVASAHWARGTTLLRTQRLDLRAEIGFAVSDASSALAARGIDMVTVPGPPEPLWVEGDTARLRQVLSNLLDNAIKYTEPGGQIRIAGWRDGQQIFVRVSDTGRGLLPHELEHIFELFSQVRPGEGRGLGIGLSVVSQIVALHRGRIDVRSAGPSCGSEFTVTLPSATGEPS